MKVSKLIALTVLIISGLAGYTVYAGKREQPTYGYASKQDKIAAKRKRTKSSERYQRWLEASKQTKAHLGQLQKTADAELSSMSPDERKKTELQMANVQKKVQQTMNRLATMSPAEKTREFEKMQHQHDAVMQKLQKENPEAYKTLKSMETMGEAMENLANRTRS